MSALEINAANFAAKAPHGYFRIVNSQGGWLGAIGTDGEMVFETWFQPDAGETGADFERAILKARAP
jgi:hypothetical protein